MPGWTWSKIVAPTKKPLGGVANFHVASIGGDRRALAGAVLDEFADAVGVLAGDDRSHARLGGGVGRADPDGLRGVDEGRKEAFGGVVADHDGGAARHATLARAQPKAASTTPRTLPSMSASGMMTT